MQKEQERLAQEGFGRKTAQGRVESHVESKWRYDSANQGQKRRHIAFNSSGTAKNPCADKFEVVGMHDRRKSLVDQTGQIAAISPFLRRTDKWATFYQYGWKTGSEDHDYALIDDT
ncbi:hypothetical protein KIN20_037202 [Parelaphostrongylus tenuis]|uniref:Uncharacterized protein n=1 Tax=Parelaphostrongylus tenuis TaxID=148309 RepID=A0AAD5RED8_PARTN|nr:hypothetical protein KIN20_037202 [Parelaphostrongylus tenuis]